MIDGDTDKKLRSYAKSRGFDEEAFIREVERAMHDLGMFIDDAIPHAEKLFKDSTFNIPKPEKAKAAGPKEAGRGSGGKATPAPPAPTPKPAAATSPDVIDQFQKGMDEAQKFKREGRPTVDPKLMDWLQRMGFTRSPDGTAFTKTTKVGEDIVKLMIDFKNNPKGNRYGYKLDESVDPPKWKNVPALRDHQTLLEFKGFRDKVPTEPKPEAGSKPAPAAPREIPAGEGQVLMQREAEALDAKDDQQILAELKGDLQAEILKRYFYSFKVNGRTVVGLSYKGVKQIARQQGHIIIKELELKETEKTWLAICKALDKARDLEIYGAASQPKEITYRDGGKAPDPFALTKAVSKAQRNALRGLISETVVSEAYKAWMKREQLFRG